MERAGGGGGGLGAQAGGVGGEHLERFVELVELVRERGEQALHLVEIRAGAAEGFDAAAVDAPGERDARDDGLDVLGRKLAREGLELLADRAREALADAAPGKLAPDVAARVGGRLLDAPRAGFATHARTSGPRERARSVPRLGNAQLRVQSGAAAQEGWPAPDSASGRAGGAGRTSVASLGSALPSPSAGSWPAPSSPRPAKNAWTASASRSESPATSRRRSTLASRTARSEPSSRSSARRLPGPMPGISSSTDWSPARVRSERWNSIAKRCASSRTRWSSSRPRESAGSVTGSLRAGRNSRSALSPPERLTRGDGLSSSRSLAMPAQSTESPRSARAALTTASCPLPPSTSSRSGSGSLSTLSRRRRITSRRQS